MARFGECWEGGPATGTPVALSNRHTRRRWLVNLRSVKADVGGGESLRMRVCTRCLKAGRVKRAV